MQTLSLSMIAAVAACTTTSTATPRNPAMHADTNKQVIHRLYEDCINPGRLELLAELVSDAYVGPRGERGAAGFATTITGLRAGFPDIHFTIDDLVAEADRVTVRWTWHATHAGTFVSPAGRFAATGKPIANTAIAIYQLADHKIVHAWLESDRLGVLQQIGALPAGFGAPAGATGAPRP
jgi:predicted ester cyclase